MSTLTDSAAPTMNAPTLAARAASWQRAGRSFGGQAPRPPGHDLGRIHVSAPPRGAPIQRMRWTWNATTQTWASKSGPTTAKPPSHQGILDGEEFEDTYSQATDPTASVHHRSGMKFMGQLGAESQVKSSNPHKDHIREPAEGGPGRRGGAGLHEVLRTNMRDFVAKSGNEALVGLQSGLRTSTDYQLFSPDVTGTGQVGAHTGFFRNQTGTGSTHTQGQAPAHDTLRAVMKNLEKEKDPDVVVNAMARAHLLSSAKGQEVLDSGYLTGADSNRDAFGTLGPVSQHGNAPDQERLALAQDTHDRREQVKTLVRSLARTRDPQRLRLASPSPDRMPIDALGQGGGHVPGDRTTWRTVPVPKFEGTGWEQYANQGAYLTAPQRHVPKSKSTHKPQNLSTVKTLLNPSSKKNKQ